MKLLCNDICRRSGDGVLLSERAQSDLRRPAWCLDEILNILDEEFVATKLKGAREKALKYMANCACMFKRLGQGSHKKFEIKQTLAVRYVPSA